MIGAAGMLLLLSLLLLRPGGMPTAQAAPLAQPPPTPEAIATWQGSGGRGYQLYQPANAGPFAALLTGLTWWDTTHLPNVCPGSGEFTDDGATVQIKGWLDGGIHTVEKRNCALLQSAPTANVLRVGQQLYFFADRQLQRKAISAGPTDAATPLSHAPRLSLLNNETPTGAVLAIDEADRLLWADRIFLDPTPLTPGDETQRNTFYRLKADDSAPAEFLFTHNNVGAVVKIEAVTYTAGRSNVDAFVWLTAEGHLYRYQPHAEAAKQVIKLAEYVADFAIHTVEYKNEQRIAKIFAAIHRPPQTEFFPHGDLLEIEPESGKLTALWPDTLQTIHSESHVVSVATDSDGLTPAPKNIYISVVVYDCDANGCTLQPGTRIYRRRLFVGSESGPCLSFFCPILEKADGGTMLASDDRWLFFARGNQIYRYPTDAPPIAVDIAATHLEVNQAIQNLHHDFPLVAGSRTVVRGYANVPLDSTGAAGFQVTARLTGLLDGKVLPGSPLAPVKDVVVDGTTDLATQRAGPSRTFLFELPTSWVQNQTGGFAGALTPSKLELTMVVNPNAAVAEAGGLGFLNNDVSVTVDVFQRETTCLAAIPMLTEAPVPDAIAPNMPGVLAHLHKLLPVSAIKVHEFHYSWLDDAYEEYLFVLSDDGDPFYMYDDGDWGDGGGRDALEYLASISTAPCPGNTHWLGVVHPDTPWGPYSGFGRTPGHVIMAVSGSSGTIAHELIHNFGRRHTKCGNLPKKEQKFDWPGLGLGPPMGVPITYDPCTLGPTDLADPATYVGFDTVGLSARLPISNSDLMSYGGNKWPSLLGWHWLLHNQRLWPLSPFVAAAQATATDEVLLVQGRLAENGATGAFRRLQRLPTVAAPAEQIIESATTAAQRADSPYQIRLLDAAGATIQATAVISSESSGHSDLVEPLTFMQYVPFPPQAQRVQLVANNQVLAEQGFSANAPQVTLTEFTLDERAERITLAWAATDADGDPLTVTLLYSSDDGATWRALGQGLQGNETRLGTRNLPASQRARLRLLVSDGFLTGLATSAPFAITPHPPRPRIDNLVNGQRLAYGSNHQVYGLALDADEGSLGSDQLQWTLRGPISQTLSGSLITLRDLIPGDYTLTLSATDSTGLTGASSINFAVQPLVIPTSRLTPGLDGMCAENAYEGSLTIALPQSRAARLSNRRPAVQMIRAEGSLYVCFTDQSVSSEGAHWVGLQVDADNSGGQATPGDIGFFVDQNGIAVQTMAFFNVMTTNPNPKPGFASAVYPTATGWSAEMRIDDGLLGGWQHAARLMVKHEITDLLHDTYNWPPTAAHSTPATWVAAYFGDPPSPANQPPVASGGPNVQLHVTKPITLYLDGGLSYDPDLDRLNYRWRQVGGPPVVLANPNQRLAPFPVTPVAAVTDLHFELIVNDGQVDSAPVGFTWRLLPPKQVGTIPGKQRLYLPLIQR